MMVGGIIIWTPPRKAGGIPYVSTRFSLSMENDQDDAGRDGRTRLARPNSQARLGIGEYSFDLFQLTTSKTGDLTRLTHNSAFK